MKKRICVLLSLCILATSSLTFATTIKDKSDEIVLICDSVIVILAHEYSDLDIEEIEYLFEDVEFAEIIDLNGVIIEKYEFPDNFHRALRLILPEAGESKALEAVGMLEQLEFVFSASPCIYYAEELPRSEFPPQDYSQDNFKPDCVILSLENEYAGLSMELIELIFAGLGFNRIRDLGEELYEQFGERKVFIRILALYLEEQERDNVLAAIEMLDQLECVQSASPNHLIPVLDTTYETESELIPPDDIPRVGY